MFAQGQTLKFSSEAPSLLARHHPTPHPPNPPTPQPPHPRAAPASTALGAAFHKPFPGGTSNPILEQRRGEGTAVTNAMSKATREGSLYLAYASTLQFINDGSQGRS